ncbi:hypothetical protein [Ornithinimicrobium sp. W1665]|uniref:hypothetical protein n=1 Tax=Ornithinimicrobium sp. W1665 TaxID=3416666 RepID=UPI003CED431B
MTAATQPLWEDEDPEDEVTLPYGLVAVVERDEAARALRWARARPDRWKTVVAARTSRTDAALARAALKVYRADTRQREKYVAALKARGRAGNR